MTLAALFALGNELAQGLVPTRHASVADALVDLAGVALGAWLFRRGGYALDVPRAPTAAERR